MIRNHGEEPVRDLLMKGVVKCSSQLGINLTPIGSQTLVDDILEVYSLDSIEDVLEALKKGRQGKYGLGFNSRSSLNLITIGEWMSNILEEKSLARENIIKNRKHEDKDFDIHESYARIIESSPDKNEKEKKALKSILDSGALIKKHLTKRKND